MPPQTPDEMIPDEMILTKVDQILRILTAIATKGMKQNEQIVLLNRVGFQPKEIAALLGTTGNTVNVSLSNLRKAKQKKGKVACPKKK
jgi:DNA-directed RNA polymerase specialized sigma24 family protein